MKRQIPYYGALVRALDPLLAGQNAMEGLGKLAEAILGTSQVVDGFTVTPTSPASMSVNLNPGQIYELTQVESSSISLLAPDTHSLLKQGLLRDALQLALVAPTTPGYAQNFLIEVKYADADTGNTTLSYYNAANPSVPLIGPGGNGQAQATQRDGTVSVQVKAGTAATSGTQVTPSPDAGWAGLYVITLSYGQTTITSGSIARYASAPFISKKLPELSTAGLTTIINAVQQNFVVIADQKTNGTAGGVFTTGAWRTRDLNTIVADPAGLTSGGTPTVGLSANTITLQPGTYVVEASAPAISVDTHKIRFQNTTDSTTAIWGTSENTTGNVSTTPDTVSTRSQLIGTVTVVTPKSFQLQHICSTTSTGSGGIYGFGVSSAYGLGAADGPETYAVCRVTKVG